MTFVQKLFEELRTRLGIPRASTVTGMWETGIPTIVNENL